MTLKSTLRLILAGLLVLVALPAQAQGAAPAPGASAAAATQPARTTLSRADRMRRDRLAEEAIIHLQNGQPALAEKALQQALAIDPTDSTNLYNMACAQALLSKSEAALDYLERSAVAGFTNFTHIAADSDLASLRDLPRFRQFLERKDEYQKRSAERVLAFLKTQLNPRYLFELDEQHKMIFASDTDSATLQALKSWLTRQATSQWNDIFDHKPDYYIAVLLPNTTDFVQMVPLRGVEGLYNPESRTLVCKKMGQVVTHEFTHALQAADLEPLGIETPIWFTEGLASMYEAGQFVGDRLVPADNYRLTALQQAARTNRLIPLRRLLTMNQDAMVAQATLAYGQASSFLLYLWDTGQLKDFYAAFKKDLAQTPRPEMTPAIASGQRALEQTTGRTLAQLEAEWRTWMLNRTPPPLTTGREGPVMGINFQEANDGLLITGLTAGGPAAKADLKVGDTIVGLNEDEVRDQYSLIPLLALREPGDEIRVRIRRGQQYLEVPLTLARRSEVETPPPPARRGGRGGTGN